MLAWGRLMPSTHRFYPQPTSTQECALSLWRLSPSNSSLSMLHLTSQPRRVPPSPPSDHGTLLDHHVLHRWRRERRRQSRTARGRHSLFPRSVSTSTFRMPWIFLFPFSFAEARATSEYIRASRLVQLQGFNQSRSGCRPIISVMICLEFLLHFAFRSPYPSTGYCYTFIPIIFKGNYKWNDDFMQVSWKTKVLV